MEEGKGGNVAIDREDFGEKIGGVDETGEEDKAEKVLAHPLLQPVETHVLAYIVVLQLQYLYFFRNFTFSEIFNFKEFSFLLTKNASSRVNEMTPTCFFCST
jgi:hypothetical protein